MLSNANTRGVAMNADARAHWSTLRAARSAAHSLEQVNPKCTHHHRLSPPLPYAAAPRGRPFELTRRPWRAAYAHTRLRRRVGSSANFLCRRSRQTHRGRGAHGQSERFHAANNRRKNSRNGCDLIQNRNVERFRNPHEEVEQKEQNQHWRKRAFFADGNNTHVEREYRPRQNNPS